MNRLRQIVDEKIEILESLKDSSDLQSYPDEKNCNLFAIQLKLLNWTSMMTGKSKSMSHFISEINKRIEFLEIEQEQIHSQEEKIIIDRNLEVLEYCKYLAKRYEI